MKRKKHKSGLTKIFYGIIIAFIGLAIFAPIIANEKPIYLSLNGQSYFPAFSDAPYITVIENGETKKIRTNGLDWKNLIADKIVFAPVCWSPEKSDLINSYVSPFGSQKILSNGKEIIAPFKFRHLLGTGKTGNDVLSSLIHGTRTSLSIGFFAMTIALLIGLILGISAGYFGDEKLRIRKGSFILILILIIPAFFYSFYLRKDIITNSFNQSLLSGFVQLFISKIFFLSILAGPIFLKFSFIPILEKRIAVPLDSMLSRLIEIFLSIPRLILILTLAAIIRPSVISIILVIGLTSWTEVARIIRAQVLQIRESNFISSSRAIGCKPWRTIIHHLLPNTFSQVGILWTYGIASAILIETGLSFLGIGVPTGTATWGKLMYEARESYQSWWLVIFAGGALFALLFSLFNIANSLKNRKRFLSAF